MGASGFVGGRVSDLLEAAGHVVLRASRRGPIRVDLSRDLDASTWMPRLEGVDVVVNAAGILRERGAQTFRSVHTVAPSALFAACVRAGVQRVVQVSALGADDAARSRFHLSKREADAFLLAQPLSAVVALPSLVYGSGGASAHLFGTLASLPLIPVPAGDFRVQPIHVDDVAACIARLAVTSEHAGGRVPLVGPEPLTLRHLLSELRAAMGLGAARFLGVPMGLVRAVARVGDRLPGGLLDSESLGMLERGNVADVAATRALLGRAPRGVRGFIAPAQARAVALESKLGWLLPLLRVAVATVWLAAGIVSLGVYPVGESYALLERTGIPRALAPAMLYGASLVDLAFGVATLTMKRRSVLWLAQMVVIVLYTAIITWKLPEFWLHPYGPVVKNLPLLAAILLVHQLEAPWTTRR